MGAFDVPHHRALHQRIRPRIILWPDGRGSRKLDIGAQCVSFQCSKAIHSPMGSWEVTLLPIQGTKGPANIMRQADILTQVRPNGVISIGMDEPGGIMMGLVDEPAQVRGYGSKGQMSITLRGSDFGKTLARDHIVRAQLNQNDIAGFRQKIGAVTGPDHSLLHDVPGSWGFLSGEGEEAVSNFYFTKVDDVVEWILNAAPSMAVPLLASIGGTGRPGEYISTEYSITTWHDGRIPNDAPHTFQGTIWDFVRRLLDEDFYEAWIDTTPKGQDIPQIQLIIRPKPFDESSLDFVPVSRADGDIGITWESLTTRIEGLQHHEIPYNRVMSMNLGHTDADVYAYYMATGSHLIAGNPDGAKEGLAFPGVDTYALKRTGLRAYEAQLSLLAEDVARKQQGDEDYTSEAALQVVDARNRLINWYRLNEYFEAGSITVPGRDLYRAGDPVFLPWYTPARRSTGLLPAKGVRFYCPAVQHSWAVGRPYTTQMQLMRGHNTRLIEHAKLDITLDAPLSNLSHLALVDR